MLLCSNPLRRIASAFIHGIKFQNDRDNTNKMNRESSGPTQARRSTPDQTLILLLVRARTFQTRRRQRSSFYFIKVPVCTEILRAESRLHKFWEGQRRYSLKSNCFDSSRRQRICSGAELLRAKIALCIRYNLTNNVTRLCLAFDNTLCRPTGKLANFETVKES